MKTALLVSPHLDDVAFSCGGVAAKLARGDWRVVVATVFTRSVHPAGGFALACQRDKGLPDDLDYMALRRAEDVAAMAVLGADPLHLDLPEAPHRGYDNAAALFGPVHDDPRPVADALGRTIADLAPALVLAPQGCGHHVDHVLTIDALRMLELDAVLGFYRDTPYVIRDRGAQPHVRAEIVVTFALAPADLDAKLRAACCYRSQVGFQFGGTDEACAALTALAAREADGHGHAERLLADTPALANALAA